MQKIFLKHIVIITSFLTIFILIINYCLSTQAIIDQEHTIFNTKINQVIRTLEDNQVELKELYASLDEDYLTRAKAFSYVIEKNPSVLNNTSELVKLAKLLNVDELHVSDEKGILTYSSVPKYIGLDFHNGKQMRGFVPILESNDPNVYVIQSAQPNTAEQKIMKYVGVARKDKKGIVQIGLSPKRQLDAEARNTYAYIFSKFPTKKDEVFFAIDSVSNTVLAHSHSLSHDALMTYNYDKLKNCDNGAFVSLEDGKEKYVVTKD